MSKWPQRLAWASHEAHRVSVPPCGGGVRGVLATKPLLLLWQVFAGVRLLWVLNFASRIAPRQRVNSAAAESWACPVGVSDVVPGSGSKGARLKRTSV